MRTGIIHIVAAIALLTFFSCRKEVSVEKPNGFAGNFTAEIDGVEWIAADSTEGASMLQGQINITGISVDKKELSITLNDTVPGVYHLDQSSASLAAYVDDYTRDLYAFTSNQGADTSQGGGGVTITEIDRVNKTISGTFSFNLFRETDRMERRVKEGVFYKLPYTNTLPPASRGDTMSATVGTDKWVAKSIQAQTVSNQLIITGSALNGDRPIGLIMPFDVTPGSYTLDYATSLIYFALYNPANNISLVSVGGTLVIQQKDAISKKITGTFQFQAVDPLGLTSQTAQVTSGYFSVSYQ